MAKESDNVVIRTASGTYSIPPEDLERYRVTKEDVTGDFKAGSKHVVIVGKQPPIQTAGRIIFSVETKVETPSSK